MFVDDVPVRNAGSFFPIVHHGPGVLTAAASCATSQSVRAANEDKNAGQISGGE